MDIVQLGGSLLAIILLAYLAKVFFPVKTKLDAPRCIRNIKRFCPDLPPEAIENADVIISETGVTAIAFLPDDMGVAAMRQMGDRVTVRYFKNVEEISLTESGKNVRININDFTLSSIIMQLSDDQKATLIAKMSKHNISETNHNTGTAHA